MTFLLDLVALMPWYREVGFVCREQLLSFNFVPGYFLSLFLKIDTIKTDINNKMTILIV